MQIGVAMTLLSCSPHSEFCGDPNPSILKRRWLVHIHNFKVKPPKQLGGG
jgi:hypothetical protein